MTPAAHYIPRMSRTVWALLLVVAPLSGCMSGESTKKVAKAINLGGTHPDEAPNVVNSEMPFRYPAALYARRVQGNVTLRLHVDRDGQVTPDSTRIEESSGYAALDSAAVKGSQELRFVPAKLRGEAISTTVLFPVYFRHPEAHALPGDTILTKRGNAP